MNCGHEREACNVGKRHEYYVRERAGTFRGASVRLTHKMRHTHPLPEKRPAVAAGVDVDV